MNVEHEEGLRKIRPIAERLAASLGYEVVEIALGGGKKSPVVQVFVDGPRGVSLDDCARLSRGISRESDELDPFPGAWSLEVSSPGLDRPFKTPDDYRRNVGRRIEVQLVEARPGGLLKFKGELKSADPAGFEVAVDGAGTVRCAFAEVRKVHRAIEFREG